MAFRLSCPINRPVGRKLRILLYARYSTEEQDASSIADQFAYCLQFLQSHGIGGDVQIDYLDDPEMSGELVSRPGINRVRDGINAREWDLIVVEDSSRLFRHETACGELVDTAVDLRIRIIAINDSVDTAAEEWEDHLYEAMRHHARSNKFTSKRIMRKLDALWRKGAAIGALHPGYRRSATNPDADNPKRRGPFFDSIDSNWSPTVCEAFERIARGDPPWLVGQWLTDRGLPKPRNAKTPKWSDKNVIALIKNPIYRGVEQYRVTIVHKKRRSGKHIQVRNDPSEVLTREAPQLRIVPDALWHRANTAIKERLTRKAIPTGNDHPLAHIPRDSRGPLSGILLCGVCSGKMVVDGRREGGYRCTNSRKGACWNKCNPLRSVVHAKMSRAIADRLLALDGVLDAMVGHVRGLLVDEGSWKRRYTKCQAKERKLVAAREGLMDAIEVAKESRASLLDRLMRRDEELAQVRAELEELEAERTLPTQLPSKERIEETIKELADRLLDMDRRVGPDLRRLTSVIRAVPYQQYGTTNVVLRAHFELKLEALLPDRILSLLKQEQVPDVNGPVHTVPMVVDLFDLSRGPAKYWAQAVALHRAGLNFDKIAKELDTNRATANRAVSYGKALVAAGLSDPFVELTAQPTKPGRWRVHPRFKQDELRAEHV